MDFSIIICSYNGSERLPKTLEYLSKLEIQQLDCEFIYVDNNSTDGSVDLVLEFWSNLGSPFPLVIETETESGVGYARKKGCQVAKGEFILFCDDDNWLASNYLHILHRIFQNQPEIGIIGGKGIAITEGEFPVWFSLFPELYAVGGRNKYTGYVEALPAAGMGIRKKLLQDYYTLFYSRFESRNKGKYTGGEDTSICLGIAWMGYRSFLTQELEFYHYIPSRRLERKHLFSLVAGIANSQLQMEGLRSFVFKIPFKPCKRFVRDVIWMFVKLHLMITNKRIWYKVWLFYRMKFWSEFLHRYKDYQNATNESYWLK